MKIFLFTSNKYANILPDQANLFNKYTGNNFQVDVLGFQKPQKKLPKNYNFISMGKQEDFPEKNWADPIRSFIEETKENYFCLFWDDLFPVKKMNYDKFKSAENLVKKSIVQKVCLDKGTDKQYLGATIFDEDFMEMNQTADYRSTLKPSIWNKEYFLKHLGKSYDPWQFEVINQEKMKNDNARILICRNEPIMEFFNVFVKGKFHEVNLKRSEGDYSRRHGWHRWSVIPDEDIKIYEKYRRLKEV
jgi:hypothetical protein